MFEGNDQVELPGITEQGDTVKGYLHETGVNAILMKLFAVTGKEGVNVE